MPSFRRPSHIYLYIHVELGDIHFSSRYITLCFTTILLNIPISDTILLKHVIQARDKAILSFDIFSIPFDVNIVDIDIHRHIAQLYILAYIMFLNILKTRI